MNANLLGPFNFLIYKYVVLSIKKEKLVKGVLWSGIDKVGVVIIQLVLELILARHIMPQEYGIMGLAMIFITFGSLFSESGFSNALIRKQDRTEQDFSTAFYFNLIVSVCFTATVFQLAHFIANYFDTPMLKDVLRVISLCVIFNALVMVHKTKLSILMDFKTQAKVSFIALLLSGTIGVVLAIKGYGVWALVAQILGQSFFTFLFFCILFFWKPLFVFSKKSFSELFGFGSNLLLAGIIQNIYVNLYNVFIGKRMPASMLGLYTKSNQFTFMPANLISSILQRVTFPFFSSYQNNVEKIFFLNQQFTRLICLSVFPVFAYVCIFAKPLVYYGLSSRWMMAVPIIQLLAIAYVFQPIIVNNMLLLQVRNNTKLYFRVEIITKITGVLILLFTFKLGILFLCYGIILQLFLQLCITSFFANWLLERSMFQQIFIIVPYIVFPGLVWLIISYVFRDQSMESYFFYGSVVFLMSYFVYYFIFCKNHIISLFKLLKNK